MDARKIELLKANFFMQLFNDNWTHHWLMEALLALVVDTNWCWREEFFDMIDNYSFLNKEKKDE